MVEGARREIKLLQGAPHEAVASAELGSRTIARLVRGSTIHVVRSRSTATARRARVVIAFRATRVAGTALAATLRARAVPFDEHVLRAELMRRRSKESVKAMLKCQKKDLNRTAYLSAFECPNCDEELSADTQQPSKLAKRKDAPLECRDVM